MESKCRPLGGIASIAIGVVPLNGAAPTSEDLSTLIPLLEDRSTYVEKISYVGSAKSVEHRLTLITAADYAFPEELIGGLHCGFFARLWLNSMQQITLGWSAKAGSDRALRLVSCTTSSGERAASRGYKEWIFESTDGESKI